MVSTFTTNVNLEKQGTGDNDGTWGVELNENFDQIDAAIGGRVAVSITTANVTLTETQYRNRKIVLSGTLTGNRNLVFPDDVTRGWVIENNTAGSFTVTAKTVSGTGVVVPQGSISEVASDGTDMLYERTLHSDQREIYGGATGGSSTAYTLTCQPAITARRAGMVVRGQFHTANTNTTPTLAVNGLSAGTIQQGDGTAVFVGQLATNAYFEALDDGTNYKLLSLNGVVYAGDSTTFTAPITMSSASIIQAEGAAVASASSPNIWATDGDTIHITGTTGISGFAAAPQAGAWKKLIFDGALLITQGANMITPGGVNLLIAAGDIVFVYAETTTQFRLIHLPATHAPAQYAPLRGYIDGLILANNGTDSANDIDVGVGMATSDDGAQMIVLSSGITKRIDANWSVGTNQGGLDTGSESDDTWYHIFLIRRPDTGVVDVLISASATSPTMPTNYTQKRRIGSIWNRQAGAGIGSFLQQGDLFLWSAPAVLNALDFDSTTLGTSGETYTLTVPTGVRVMAIFNAGVTEVVAHVVSFYSGALGFATLTPNDNSFPIGNSRSTTQYYSHQQHELLTDTSAQIRAISNNANTNVQGWAIGWKDFRGRDA